jgi:hypothetical protein
MFQIEFKLSSLTLDITNFSFSLFSIFVSTKISNLRFSIFHKISVSNIDLKRLKFIKTTVQIKTITKKYKKLNISLKNDLIVIDNLFFLIFDFKSSNLSIELLSVFVLFHSDSLFFLVIHFCKSSILT